jgi:NAD(P)-dependent dehydrogenase (short-subunit alcohol dehydrogenase family)
LQISNDLKHSSSGLGLATVEELVALDAYVSILDRDSPPTHISSERIKFFKTDITVHSQVESAVEGTVSWTHETGSTLGGVINCAGVGVAAKILDSHNNPHSLDLWDFALAVNLTGTFNLSRLVLKHLAQVAPEEPDGERGVIIMVSSAAAVSSLYPIRTRTFRPRAAGS